MFGDHVCGKLELHGCLPELATFNNMFANDDRGESMTYDLLFYFIDFKSVSQTRLFLVVHQFLI
jgi:hypothetical protein